MEETAMVKSNDFEVLLEKIEKEKEEDRNSYLNKLRMTGIIKEIMSVYYFLRQQVGMPHRQLSVEEFRIARNKLDELAKKETMRNALKFLFSWRKNLAWNYYLKNGYFHVKRTPFGWWWNLHDYKKKAWRPKKWFRTDSISERVKEGSYTYVFPPNILDLAESLFQERFVKSADGKGALLSKWGGQRSPNTSQAGTGMEEK